ncbi:MAG: hypothetical protein PHH05_08175 [Syntrophaceticus sp.]|nr:hypothetical protein [Syntrophaceticus sp.]
MAGAKGKISRGDRPLGRLVTSDIRLPAFGFCFSGCSLVVGKRNTVKKWVELC